jgi:hypothetical protein
MSWYVAVLSLCLLVYAILLAWVLRSRSVPHFVPKLEMEMIDDLREEIRGKPFDNLTTIQKIWTES